MTLVELLVVVSIVVLLVATSVPLMKPALDDSHLREGARQVNVYFAAARARAIQKRRPVGVLLERHGSGENAVMDLYMVEEPLPYAGDFLGATVTLLDENGSDGKVETARFLSTGSPTQLANSSSFPFFVEKGDLIQFNYQGPKYRIVSAPTTSTSDYRTVFQPEPSIANQGPDGAWGRSGVDDDNDGTIDNRSEAGWWSSDDGPSPPRAGVAVSYQVFRKPRRSTVNPLQLAGGICIDLEYSGIGANGVEFDAALQNQTGSTPLLNDEPVIIMFDPSGAISIIYTGVFNGSTSAPAISLVGGLPQGTIYLLLGRFDQTRLPPDANGNLLPTAAPRTNLEDPRNVWISIGDRTGAVSSAENGGDSSVALAREFARSGQGMGGR